MTELAQYLESMEPDMMNVTRLFGIADAAWEGPAAFPGRHGKKAEAITAG